MPFFNFSVLGGDDRQSGPDELRPDAQYRPLSLLAVPAEYPQIWQVAAGDSYSSADDAARAAMREIYEPSRTYANEYAGRIYRKWFGFGDYSYSSPNSGTPYGSDPGNRFLTPLINSFGVNEGYYHSRPGAYDRAASENFSRPDMETSNYEGKPGYLVTPTGILKKYTPREGVTTIGTVSR
ncbi:MAG TPA: DUF4329 domain-containing protein [Pseudolabrys sp.]|nr:DUF4329 domain-containing protein [Pseudolabrys sp.]